MAKTIQARHLGYDPDVWDTVANPLVLIGDEARELRIKSETINIGGHDVPFPVLIRLKSNQEYWHVDIGAEELNDRRFWRGNDGDIVLLEHGLIHLTKEAAIAHAEALLSFTRSNK